MRTGDKGEEKPRQQSEDRFRLLFDSAADALFLHDLHGRFVEVNQAACDSLGYTREELLQKHVSDIEVGITPETMVHLVARILRGEQVTLQGRNRRRDGATFPVEVRLTPFGYAGCPHILASTRDITGRLQTEEALQTSESFLNSIIDQSPYPMWISDSRGTLLKLNQACQDLLNITAAEVVGRYNVFSDNIVEQQGYYPLLQRVFEKGETVRFELAYDTSRLKNPQLETDKSLILDVTVSSITDTRGRITNAVFQHVDITQRKQAEEALRESERKYRSLYQEFQGILNAIPDSLCLISPDMQIVWANEVAPAELNMQMSDYIGHLCYQARHGRSAPCEVCAVQKCFATGKPAFGESTLPDGRIWELRALPLFGDQGEVKGVIELARNITERKRMEEALLQSEAKFRQVVEVLPLPMGIATDDGMIEYVNPKFLETFGYTLKEIPTLEDWFRLAYPDPAYRQQLFLDWQQSWEKSIKPQAATEVRETEVTCKDGSTRIIQGIATLMQDKSLMVGHDLTERKRAEQALRESEARFRQVVENSPLPIAIAVEGGLIEYVNPKFVETFGYTLGDVPLLEDWYRQAYPDPAYRRTKIGHWQEALEKAGREGRPTEIFEVEVTCKDGSQKIIDIFGTLVGNKTLGIFTDVTERKRAGEALRESEARFRLVVENSPLPIGILSGDQIEYLNPRFAETFGYTLEDIPQITDWFRLAYPDPEHRQWISTRWRQALEEATAGDGNIQSLEVEVACKDGSMRTMESWGILVGGKIVVFCKDLTERKRAEEERDRLEAQMREVQKLESLGVLAGGIAHDFNNLLMAILGNADLALLSLSLASPTRPNVEEIVLASQRAADLCRQMLAYSGKGRFVIGRYDLTEIVREMAQILKVSVSKKAVLRYSFAGNLPAVEVDATQMRQVIMNLITNASEALSDASGVISVSTGVMDCDRAYLAESHLDDKLPDGRYVYLEVADTGGGMNEETRRRLFDPFFTTKFTGRGLGLAAVLGIVRGHRGAIKVASKPRKGTTFTILLPAVAWQPDDRVLIATLAAAPHRQGTILLIDDDPHVRRVAGEMLARLGLQVLTGAHGQEGLEIFQEKEEEIDCVLLDLTMPGMGGEEAFQEMRRLRPDVRVVLSSGYDEQDATQQFTGQGLAGFIQKPYTVAKLQEVLNRVLGQ
jgi:PAS domain S-box-containing protein